ncbi:MAG: FG-GAP repeat protein [Acidobacteria bacterium]|nr:FG-GAP repeat protein [Acidobacteriota bacterium]
MARYSVNWVNQPRLTKLGAGAYEAHNPAQGFTSYFTPEAVALMSGTEAQSPWTLEMNLKGIGYGDRLAEISSGTPSVKNNRIELNRSSSLIPHPSSLSEWYENGPKGLEQGLTIPMAPGERSEGDWVRVSFGLDSSLEAQLVDEGQAIEFLNWSGERVLRYDQLVVTDASGRQLPSRMDLGGSQIRLEYDDREAVYPVTIDPTFGQQSKLVASDGAANDLFGVRVAISGETAVIGAIGDTVGANGSQGSAYVFVRSGTAWSQQQKLTAADGAASDLFGISVAIDGDTVVVGTRGDDVGANANQGSAYVFVRSGTTWAQQQKLTASDGAANDNFGQSVAINSNTVVVGANLDDVGASGNRGSAYVFVRTGTIWTQQQQLTAAGGADNDQFGSSVAISGDTVVVGAFQVDVSGRFDQGSAYVFVRSGTTWSQQQQLTASDGAGADLFGVSVAISGETVVVGAPQADVSGRSSQGAAYVFVRSGTVWSQQQKLTASDGAANDDFGRSVAISGETVVAGSRQDDVGGNGNQGSAYVFVRTGSVWVQQQQLSR